jgi:hypothetical protein
MRRTIIAGLITALLLAGTPSASAASTQLDASIASFEGSLIDLRNGWGEAKACASDGIATQCFRTEAELDQYLNDGSDHVGPRALLDFVIQSVCSVSLKLYSSTSYGGTVLALTTRFTFLNLSTWSFSNVTSSYQVGACSATFYDGAGGGSPIYPGSTSAWSSATSMLAGWDNRVSSVYIS